MKKASELDFFAKQEILGKIREFIGDLQYQNLINTYGEDFVIEYYYSKSKQNKFKRIKESIKAEWKEYLLFIYLISASLVGIYTLYNGSLFPWQWEIVLSVFFLPGSIIYLIGLIFNSQGMWPLGIIAFIGVILLFISGISGCFATN